MTRLGRFAIVIAAGLVGCGADSLERRLDRYIDAANRHDLAILSALTAADAVWYLGPDTLVGKAEMLKPSRFDEGANTRLRVSNVVVRADTVDFVLAEENDVLIELGIPELHHYPRFVFRNGLIYRKLARRPPREFEAFRDSVQAFAAWLLAHDSIAYARLWPDGRFAYGRETGERMARLVRHWRER